MEALVRASRAAAPLLRGSDLSLILVPASSLLRVLSFSGDNDDQTQPKRDVIGTTTSDHGHDARQKTTKG